MTTTVVYSSSGDGYLSSVHSTYSGMYNGTSVSLVAGGTTAWHGRNNNGGNYQGFETFMTFSYAAVAATEVVTAAYVRLYSLSILSPSFARHLDIRPFAYSTLAIDDWRTPVQFAALPETGTRIENVNGSSGKYIFGGSDGFTAAVQAGTSIQLACMASNQYSGTAPTQDEGGSFYLNEQTGTSQDPALVFTTVSRSRLNHVLGAQVMLADGTWAYLESDAATTPTITLKHCTTAGTVITAATVPTGTGGTDFDVRNPAGAQALALCIDSVDNLYVVGKVGNASNSLAAKGYVKGGGYTWTAQTTRSWPLAAYGAQINGCAAAYHPTAGGVLVCVFGHSPSNGIGGTGGNELSYAILDVQYLRTGVGSLMNNHGSAMTVGLQTTAIDPSVFNAYANETGSGLDVTAALSGNSSWGYVTSFTKEQSLSDNRATSPARYIVAGTGTVFSHATTDDGPWALKDAGGKMRAVAVSSSTVAYLSTDSDAGFGISIQVMQYSGSNPGGVLLAYDALASNSITNMPDGPACGVASWWDAIYNSVNNTLLIYYRDSANARILRRTTFNLTTMLSANDSTIVTTLGSGTASIQAVRVQRNTAAGTRGLVQLAVLDTAVYTLVNVIDTFNLAPTAPTLTPRNNFDATVAATFAWTFNDPNAGDTQTAFQLQIYDVSDNSLDHDTGKITSVTPSRSVTGATLTNGKSYRWRVRTYDVSDAAGEWSTYGTFSTMAGGTVTITDPATDNIAGINTDDYAIDWSVAGTTQAGYKVRVIRTDNSAVLSDTGWVVSTATTATISGMLTNIEYRIEVTVRNAALVETGIATRLITPDYGTPEVPLVTATGNGEDGYVLIVVSNPAPTGDRPEVTRNDILRQASGEELWTVVGSCDPDGTFRDYTAASGVAYQYIARGVSP